MCLYLVFKIYIYTLVLFTLSIHLDTSYSGWKHT